MNKLAQARKDRGWNQLQLVSRLTTAARAEGVTLPAIDTLRVNLSTWENGRHQPNDLYRRLLCGVLGTDEHGLGLVMKPPAPRVSPTSTPGDAAESMGGDDGLRVLCRLQNGEVAYVTMARRAFLIGAGSVALAGGGGAGARATTTAAALPAHCTYGPTPVEHFERVRQLLIDSDNLLGPGQVLPAVHQHIDTIRRMRRASSGGDRQQLLGLQTKFGEFASWLHQDSGDFAAAQTWLDRSLQWSHAFGDADLTAYVLARKAQLAAETGDGDDVVDLAQAAQRVTAPGGRLSAVALTYEGYGHALAGDATSSERVFDQVRQLTSEVVHDPQPWGSWLGPAYVDAHRAMSLEALGKHDEATRGFAAAMDHLDADYHRDRGVYLARQAVAHAKAGDPEPAAVMGSQAISFAEGTGSGRILSALVRLDKQLRPWAGSSEVDGFRDAFDSILVHQA